MVNQQIEKLLILQDRDQVVRRFQDQLEAIPQGIQALEAGIEAEKKALLDSKAKLQGLEVRRKELEVEVGAAEDQISKYRNQQLQVKKNEEYQALTHEIELTEKKIADWEEEEIGVLIDIDAESEAFARRQAVFDSNIGKIQAEIEQLREKRTQFEQELKEAASRFEEARDRVEAAFLTPYDRLASRSKLPVVVAVEGQKCTGCHLRVSNDISELVRKGEELTTCDNCGRIVYFAS